MLIALPHGRNKGTASFVFSDGKQQDATRIDNAIVTNGPLMHVSDCSSVR